MKSTENLVDIINLLRDPEKVVLIHALNKYDGSMTSPIHEGSLPFVDKAYAQRALKVARNVTFVANPKQQRYIKQIENKLGFRDIKGVSFQMRLNTKRMQYALGGRSVMRIPSTKKVEAGIRWQQFGKKYVRPEVHVFQNIECHLVQGTVWNITCNQSVRDFARTFLFSKYGRL